MCGICGIWEFGRTPCAETLKRMCRTLRHRGPDAQGIAIFGDIGFGHRRLAVIDLSPEANQPLSDISGQYHLVYNGEIYNYRELRTELDELGARFKTRSDSEVLLEAYKC